MSDSSPELPSSADRLRIGELASRAGVSVRSLRYYETQDLITSERTSGGHRLYDLDSVDRVLLIQELFAAGLTSRDVVTMLPCIYSGTTTPEMITRIVTERDRIDAELRRLRRTRARLTAVLVEAERRVVDGSAPAA